MTAKSRNTAPHERSLYERTAQHHNIPHRPETWPDIPARAHALVAAFEAVLQDGAADHWEAYQEALNSLHAALDAAGEVQS